MLSKDLLSQSVLDAIQLPIYVVDRDLRFVICNRAFYDRYAELSLPIGNPIGRPLRDVLTFLAPEVEELFRSVLDTGHLVCRESTVTFAARSSTAEICLGPVFTDSHITHVVTTIRDLTAQRQMQEALSQSEERFKLQYLSLPVPTFTWEGVDDDFVLVGYNQAAEAYTEGRIDDLVGQRASALYGADSQILIELRECLARQGTVQREMAYVLRSRPEQRYVRAYYVFIPPNQVQVHSIDLTAHKAAEEQLREARDELERRILDRTRELAEANEQLTVERETLRSKNAVLRELIDQFNESRRITGMQVQANIDRIVMPLLEHLEGKVDGRLSDYVSLIKSSLQEVASPLVGTLEAKFRRLTPHEVQICGLVVRGYSSKEIANVRNSSVQTVLKQRKTIRKKLGLSGQDANLATFLAALTESSVWSEEMKGGKKVRD